MERDSDKKSIENLLTNVPVYLQKVQCDTNENTRPFKCAVKSCSNYFHSFHERDNNPYKFHKFPTDEVMSNIWKSRCALQKSVNVTDMMVCSAHFYLDDYQRNYKEEFANPNFKRRLKSNAIPSQSLTTITVIQDEGINDHGYQVPAPTGKLDYDEVKKVVDLNDSLQKKYKELLQKVNQLKRKSSKVYRNTKNYQKLLRKNRNSSEQHDDIQKVFSISQIKLLLGKKKVYWTDDDLAKAFTLRHIGGRKCYLYLKNTLNMPLPALSCVQRWASTV